MRKLLAMLFILPAFACGYYAVPDVDTIVVGIQPLGNLKPEIATVVSQTLEEVYGTNVVVMPGEEIPEHAFINVKSPRYRADILIKWLKENRPDSIDYVVGLTSKDISTTKRDGSGNIKKPESKYKDWGIFGLGYRPGPSCIISTFRIKSAGQAKYMDRLKKVSVHELGHNMGLKHCDADEKCVMRDAAETIKTVDNVDLALCETCKSIIN